MLTPASQWETKTLKDVWEVFDFSRDGRLSLYEIERAVTEVLPQMAKHKEVILLAFKTADTSEDEFIQFNEFEDLLRLLCQYDRVWKKFEQLDTSGDHRVSFDEFREGYGILGLPQASEDDLRRDFDSMDSNRGGYVLFNEFCVYFARRAARQAAPTAADRRLR
eukprot:m51a1_g1297 hypothetical protein (164) ;mRNA; f:187974-188588